MSYAKREECRSGERLRVSVDDGKYTVIQLNNGEMVFFRYGEPWPAADDLKHVGLVLALAYDLDEARQERDNAMSAGD